MSHRRRVAPNALARTGSRSDAPRRSSRVRGADVAGSSDPSLSTRTIVGGFVGLPVTQQWQATIALLLPLARLSAPCDRHRRRRSLRREWDVGGIGDAWFGSCFRRGFGGCSLRAFHSRVVATTPIPPTEHASRGVGALSGARFGDDVDRARSRLGEADALLTHFRGRLRPRSSGGCRADHSAGAPMKKTCRTAVSGTAPQPGFLLAGTGRRHSRDRALARARDRSSVRFSAAWTERR